ncbi:MAG: TonB-dependent receptor domain-containing protein, partial [Candidatus Binatia bacterium]
MWIATLLEPLVSLFHSYLGKALYEVKLEEPARDQFAIAKKLDPRDPTPWFYNAILKQSVNRPVEALHDLQRSIELNDNRAVFRSRLLLDEDLAARGATLGRIYNNLGFQQLGLVEGWKSLNIDPTNYSAHRLLADTYAALPRHEIARVSQLLQSQLLQPINTTPVQPQLAESGLFINRTGTGILDGAGPAEPSLNEFNPLFVRDRLALLASGVVGEKDTLGNELVPYGVGALGRASFSFGQSHYETDGFRLNNDLNQNIYNAFLQVSPSYNTSIQAEFRYSDARKGDRGLRFIPDDFLPNERQEREAASMRVGLHHAFAPGSDFVGSFIYKDVDHELRDRNPIVAVDFALDEEGYIAEGQYLFRSKGLNVVSGVGRFATTDRNEVRTVEITPPLPFLPPIRDTTVDTENIFHTNLYAYSQINYLKNVTLTLGLSADFFEGAFVERDQVNPKLGVTWNPFPGTTVRGALFRVLKRRLISDQTIEPTQVAGFNQFFDDAEGTDAWRYGIAVDQNFSANVSAGAEFSKRGLDVPIVTIAMGATEIQTFDWDEYLARGYLYWTPHPWLAASAEYRFERFDRREGGEGTGILEVDTHHLPLGIDFFHPSGFFAGIKATYVDQDGSFVPRVFVPGTFVPGSDHFWVADVSIG